MGVNNIGKKKLHIFLLILTVITVVFMVSTVVANKASAINVSVNDDKIEVYVGSTSGLTTAEARNYLEQRSNYLNEISNSHPSSMSDALIVLSDFISTNELKDIIGMPEEIKTVYIWVPNKTGRAILNVKGNDISATISDFFDSLDLENETDEVFKNDMLKLMDNYGIFAVEVRASNLELADLQGKNIISSVDVLYNSSAEQLSAKENRPISYVCIPDKPDGTY